MGFIPAATDLQPSRKMARARMVAVVVPSPAMSLVLLATYLIKLAPIFMNLSLNSMDLATVTPSLVILGAPKLWSMTTFLPFGPRVTYTASASLLQPSNILARHSLPNRISLPAENWDLKVSL
jgi:hypothetical protein